MIREELTDGPSARRAVTRSRRACCLALKLDGPLLVGPGAARGLRTGGPLQRLGAEPGHRHAHGRRTCGMGTVAMLVLAQANPNFLRRLSPWLYVLGVLLLLVVAGIGVIGKGAQRWLNLGLFRFQPSEIMKLAVPMMCAWYLHERPLPPESRVAAAAGGAHPRAGRAGRDAAGSGHRRADRRRRRAGGHDGGTAGARRAGAAGAGRRGRLVRAGTPCTTTSASAY